MRLAGGRAVFASGLSLHLRLTGIGALLLVRLRRSPRLSEGPATRAGYFAAAFLVPHLAFYTAALLTVWPGMSWRLCSTVRPCAGWSGGSAESISFCLPFTTSTTVPSVRLETVVVGQRHLQVHSGLDRQLCRRCR